MNINNLNQKYKIKINQTNEKKLNESFKPLQHVTKTVYRILKRFHTFLEFQKKKKNCIVCVYILGVEWYNLILVRFVSWFGMCCLGKNYTVKYK